MGDSQVTRTGAKSITGLLASAQEFLVEALRNFSDHKPRLAIVHAVTAAELVLKERLARVNPGLIRKNIDAKVPEKEHTVMLSALPQRLANLGMPLSPRDSQLIATMAEWRNQIVHHMPAFNSQAAQRQLPQLLEFLAGYLRTQLATPIESFLPKALYAVAHCLLVDWQKAVATAQATATAEGNVLADTCPRCGSVAVMCLRADAVVHCHLCEATLRRCDSCDGCGRKVVISYDLVEGENFCDDCIEAAGDRYLQMQSDIARAK